LIKIKISEEELLNSFIDVYGNKKEIKMHMEVPVFCRSVDLVIQETRQEIITALEFKIDDWRRAIMQVQRVALCFDFLYICIPKPKTQKGYNSVVTNCEAKGVGLYMFDLNENSFEKFVDSPKTETVWSTQKRRVIGYLEAKEYEKTFKNP
jgi:hypothetical protein